MSFEAGLIHVICPRCGIALHLPVSVSRLEVTPWGGDTVKVQAVLDMSDGKHSCKTIGG